LAAAAALLVRSRSSYRPLARPLCFASVPKRGGRLVRPHLGPCGKAHGRVAEGGPRGGPPFRLLSATLARLLLLDDGGDGCCAVPEGQSRRPLDERGRDSDGSAEPRPCERRGRHE